MDTNTLEPTPDESGLYVPYCVQKGGPAQPIGTAFALETGKRACLQHLLQRQRTAWQRLPPEQRAGSPAPAPDAVRLEWGRLPSGVYEGEASGTAENPPPGLTEVSYRLAPA